MIKPIPHEVLLSLSNSSLVMPTPEPGEDDDGIIPGRSVLEHLDACAQDDGWFEVGPRSAAAIRCGLRDLAVELLALRAAAREVSGQRDIADLLEAIMALRELLPKEDR